MGRGADEILRDAKSGRVTTIFCEDVFLGRRQVRATTEELELLPTLVALEWDQAPSLAAELDEIRNALADAAASLWPDWYITAEARFDKSSSQGLDFDRMLIDVGRRVPGASNTWLRWAWKLCAQQKRPIVPSMATAEQVRQLAYALDPSRLVFALSVAHETASDARIQGLARAAEWLAHETQAKTVLLLPANWVARRELDHVTYGAVTLNRDAVRSEPDEDALTAQTHRNEHPAEINAPSKSAPLQIIVGPITGRPHPASEVEQLVYEQVSRDPELKLLFQYNQRLTGYGDKHYIVDLVWHDGGLVIELDGPEHHGQMAYVRDRDRDYRLLMAGYLTLRIPNAEVYANIDPVLDKIRNLVRNRRLLPKNKSTL